MQIFPNGLCKSVFDNNQKIGKMYLILGTNKVPSSVITSHLGITLDANNTIQNVQSFNPTNWMLKPLCSGTNKKLLKTLSSPGEGFRKSRDAVIES